MTYDHGNRFPDLVAGARIIEGIAYDLTHTAAEATPGGVGDLVDVERQLWRLDAALARMRATLEHQAVTA